MAQNARLSRFDPLKCPDTRVNLFVEFLVSHRVLPVWRCRMFGRAIDGRNPVASRAGGVLAAPAGPLTPATPAAAQSADRPVTFTKDIAPILQRSCQNCHHPDS